MEPESESWNAAVTAAETQNAIAETVRTELELGMTFLDVAQNTRDRKHAWQSVKNAITALRTANRLLSNIRPGAEIDALRQRREQLAERLRAITNADEPRR